MKVTIEVIKSREDDFCYNCFLSFVSIFLNYDLKRTEFADYS